MLQVEGRSAGTLQKQWDGVREKFWIGLGTHLDSGFRFSQSTEHPFYRPFTFILFGAQHFCDTSSVKEYPGNLRVREKIWSVLILGKSSREKSRSLLYSDL